MINQIAVFIMITKNQHRDVCLRVQWIFNLFYFAEYTTLDKGKVKRMLKSEPAARSSWLFGGHDMI